MKILLVAATENEIQPTRQHCAQHWIENGPSEFTKGQITLEILVTGIGMVRTAFALGNRLAFGLPDLCINAGIAGSFRADLKIGDTVHVTEDMVFPFGAEDSDGSALTTTDMGLEEDIAHIGGLVNTDAAEFAFLPAAKGITVNLVHGSLESIEKATAAFKPDIETMESAAFFHACLKTGVPFIALRTISNLVEPRDRDNWNIPLAIENLNGQVLELLNTL